MLIINQDLQFEQGDEIVIDTGGMSHPALIVNSGEGVSSPEDENYLLVAPSKGVVLEGPQESLTDVDFQFLLVKVAFQKIPFEYLPGSVIVHKDGSQKLNMRVVSIICGQSTGQYYLFLDYSD